MSLFEMSFKDDTPGAPIWSLFLSSLLLLVVLFICCPVMSLKDQIKKKIRLFSKWLLHEKANKESGVVRFGVIRPDLHGMENHEIKVLEFLESSTCSLLGIYGIHGVGKTTLLRLVRDAYAYYGSFDYILFAGAGIGCSVGSLQDALARNIGLGPPLHMSNISIAKIISSFLRDKSFMLLLEDMWEKIDLAAIGLPVPLGQRQKVIFTTRNPSICIEMGCVSNTIQMRCLEEDVAWGLFKYNVGDEIIDSNLKIKELAKQMVAECRGFPGALCYVGRTMSIKRNIKDWRVAHDTLTKKCPLPNEIQDMHDEGYPCLQFFEDTF